MGKMGCENHLARLLWEERIELLPGARVGDSRETPRDLRFSASIERLAM